ncbi:U32 family peptidase [Solemya velum gill symbiont]|nr:U32 family peptidase [Solemya velum gill symbiont]OOY34086.1 U32 family peptidase [Solemya velum gill symbiont]OOY36716.1 U32 family peptidase [Solemya velum gill symbiont]OOY40531.1 U32 family peptidase [Solemya velum gill symbiont]OOY43723.1 U32 family peptidase [Solemya velum gill symbiont]OOY45891.1 U32 family peptidase [Solemya velum gill symbiont]
MNESIISRLSLGPVQYHWTREQLLDFYTSISDTQVDIVYLGETVCSKRRMLKLDDWLGIARELSEAGKEVILSTLALIEAESEILSMKRICENGQFRVEANDMASVHMLEKIGAPFVGGPTLNLYNQKSIEVLAKSGMYRWVMPVELSRKTFMDIRNELPGGLETEVFAYGRLPLAFSARCFTARAHDLPKDDCQLRCIDDPDGLLMKTREDEEFLVLNGIQTQSAHTFNLIAAEPPGQAKIDVLRISPQSRDNLDIIHHFDAWRNGCAADTDVARMMEEMMPTGVCNGYWLGEPGMNRGSVEVPLPG